MNRVSIFIGRTNPFHEGHKDVILKAMDQTDFLIYLLGSHDKTLNTRDMFTTYERIEIAKASIPEKYHERIMFVPIVDYMYNLDRWIASIYDAVYTGQVMFDIHKQKNDLYLIGMKKDSSSFYLNLFPKWKSIEVKQEKVLSATDIRHNIFTNYTAKEYIINEKLMNSNAVEAMYEIITKNEERFEHLGYEYNYEKEYKKNWGVGPFLTCDAVVVQTGHILLVQRGREYGHGQWALPGGFFDVNKDMSLVDGSLRELNEETKIKVPEKVLRGNIKKTKIYDDPFRSNRARLITSATLIRLEDVGSFPNVKGSDDAQDAKWVPISKFMKMRSRMFEDHFCVIEDLLSL